MGLPVIVGIMAAALASRATLRWRRFGSGELVLSTTSPKVGGTVAGTVRLAARLPDRQAFTLTLMSVTLHQPIGNSDGPAVVQTTNWQTDAEVALVAMESASLLRFSFTTPDDLPATAEQGDTAHKWLLHVRSDRGVGYDQTFDLALAPARPLVEPRRPRSPPQTDQTADGWIELHRDGAVLEIRFPPFHQTGTTLLFVVVGGGFLIGGWFALGDSNTVPAVLLGGIGLAAVAMGVGVNLLERVVCAEPGRLRTALRIAGIPAGGIELRAAAIRRLEVDISGHLSMGGSATLFHRLRAHTDAGPVTIGNNIRDARTAEQLRRAIASALGLDEWT